MYAENKNPPESTEDILCITIDIVQIKRMVIVVRRRHTENSLIMKSNFFLRLEYLMREVLSKVSEKGTGPNRGRLKFLAHKKPKVKKTYQCIVVYDILLAYG